MRLPFRVPGGLATTRGFNGIVVRLPLRTKPSSISSSICSEDMVKSALKSLDYILEGSLVFSNTLTQGSCRHYYMDSAEDAMEVGSKGDAGDSLKSVESGVLDYYYVLKTPSSNRNGRRQLLLNKGWKGSYNIFKR